jgi:hypothetical protein
MAPTAKKGRGRPQKFATEEERKAARQRTKQESYQRRKGGQSQVGRQQQDAAAAAMDLRIEFDPRSILQQAGPESDAQITAPESGIQAEGLGIPIDEEQRELLQVDIGSRFPSANFSLLT